MKTMREKEVEETRRLLHLWGVGQVESIRIVKRVGWHLDDAARLESELARARAENERLHAVITAVEYNEAGGIAMVARAFTYVDECAEIATTTEDKR